MKRLLLGFAALWLWMPVEPALAQGSVEIDRDWTLVSSQRSSRTHFDYTYRVIARNSGSEEAVQVSATASSLAGTTQLIDADVAFGTIQPGRTAASSDTFTVRVDRTRPFDRSQIVWTIRATEPAAGVLLEGPPGAAASSSLVSVEQIRGPEESHVGLDERGVRIARTELLIQLEPTATVGEVNGLLRGFGARIVWMMPDVPQLLIEFPDPGDVQALNALVAQLRASPAVGRVLPAYFPKPAALPPPFDPSTLAGFSAIDHLLGVGAAAAWNARAGLTPAAPPTVLVVDYFGGGAVFSPPFGVHVFEPFFFSRATYDFRPTATGHGYHVLGIIGADFGGEPATGVFPATATGPLDVDVIDILLDPRPEPRPAGRRVMSMIDVQATLLTRLRFTLANRPVVVNTSIEFACEDERTDPATPIPCDRTMVEESGATWAQALRAANLEGSFVHVTAAGNELAPGDVDAGYASPFAAAALLPLVDESGNTVANLTNTLVVENLTQSPTPPYAPACLWGGYATNGGSPVGGSKLGGEIGAVGAQVFSYIAPSRFTDSLSGTSMASPVVAGTAAYLWAFDPALSPEEIKGVLVGTARPLETLAPEDRPADCRAIAEDAAPALDAYSALLRADDPAALVVGGNPAKAPVRSAVLDVANSLGEPGADGSFDGGDLARFAQELSVPAGTAGCGGYDWSRYDLNGDGRTGGCRTERFDLDANGALVSARQEIAGAPVEFNETGLSDIEVLCYYAFSPLYRGSEDDRGALLRGEGMCGLSRGVVTVTEWESPNLSGRCGLFADYSQQICSGELTAPMDAAVAVSGTGDSFAFWLEPREYSDGAPCVTPVYQFDGGPGVCVGGTNDGLRCSDHSDCELGDCATEHYSIIDTLASTSFAVRAARLRPGSAAPEVTDFGVRTMDESGTSSVAVAANARGDAMAAWITSPNQWTSGCEVGNFVGRDEVWAIRFDKDAGWGSPSLVWQGGPSSSSPKLALDAAGNASVVWLTSNASGSQVNGARFSVESGWGTATALGSGACSAPHLGMSPEGRRLVFWPTNSGVQARRADPGADWTAEEQVGPAPTCSQPLAALDSAGNAVVIAAGWMRRLDAATGWSPILPSLTPPRIAVLFGESESGASQTGRFVDAVLGSDGRLAMLGLAREVFGNRHRSVLWSAHYDETSRTWLTPAAVADFQTTSVNSAGKPVGFAGTASLDVYGIGGFLYSEHLPYGLHEDGCGNLSAWGAYTSLAGDRASAETFTVVGRRYSADAGSWGPSAELYAAANDGRSSGSTPSSGVSTAMLGSDGCCGQIALGGVEVEFLVEPNDYVSYEWSLGITRLTLPGQ